MKPGIAHRQKRAQQSPRTRRPLDATFVDMRSRQRGVIAMSGKSEFDGWHGANLSIWLKLVRDGRYAKVTGKQFLAGFDCLGQFLLELLTRWKFKP